MAKRRETPVLNLSPELPSVVSQDFNLFYKPQAEPEVAGVKELTASLNNFINDAGTKMVISSERKLKKEEVAKAEKDYLENKLKFRDAVKEGKIDKLSNPYYIEKYKSLTLNDYANKFIDKLGKEYKNKGVVNDLREGSFSQFYKAELDKFIKENQLGFFDGVELENSFFKETSSYRAILENNHRQQQLKEFETKFNEKVENRIFGILEKFKDFEGTALGDFDDGVSKYTFLGDKIQKEIGSLLEVGEFDVTDRILKGLEKFVKTTGDFEYAKEVINNLPKFIKGGTGSFADIGKVKIKQEELMNLLIEQEELKLSNNLKLREAKEKTQSLKTYDFLYQNKDNEDFNILDYRNSSDRTAIERKAIDMFMKDQQFDGGNSDNKLVMNEISKLLREGKFTEAEEFARKNFYSGNIRKSTFDTIMTSDIPNYRNFKDKPVFSNQIYTEYMKGINAILSSNANYGDKLQAGTAKALIEKKMLGWYKENHKEPKYRSADGTFKSELFEQDFLNYFNNVQVAVQNAKYPDGKAVFPALQFDNNKSFNAVEAEIDKVLKTPKIPD